MLVGTALISITASTADSIFARKYGRHDVNNIDQAASISNSCLNPDLILILTIIRLVTVIVAVQCHSKED
jgi:hypothetical protein